jgi:hypothetical protein
MKKESSGSSLCTNPAYKAGPGRRLRREQAINCILASAMPSDARDPSAGRKGRPGPGIVAVLGRCYCEAAPGGATLRPGSCAETVRAHWTVGGAVTVEIASTAVTVPGFLVVAAAVYAALDDIRP